MRCLIMTSNALNYIKDLSVKDVNDIKCHSFQDYDFSISFLDSI